jgi:hypothetical protein
MTTKRTFHVTQAGSGQADRPRQVRCDQHTTGDFDEA